MKTSVCIFLAREPQETRKRPRKSKKYCLAKSRLELQQNTGFLSCTNVIESVWEKKGKYILPIRLLEKKFLMTRNFNYAKLEKNPDSRRLKGITFRTDVYNDLSFVTG